MLGKNFFFFFYHEGVKTRSKIAQKGLAGNIPIPGNVQGQGEQTGLVQGDPARGRGWERAEFKFPNPNHARISRQDFQAGFCVCTAEKNKPNAAIP